MGIATRIAVGIAAVAGAVLVALLSALAFLHAPWGASRLCSAVERAASGALEGTVRIGSLHPTSLLGIEAGHVLLLDPDGHPAIAVEKVVARLDPAALARGTFRIEILHFYGARVELAPSPEGGLALSRALRPSGPPKPPPARQQAGLPPPPPLPIDLESLHVDGAFRMAHAPGGEATVLVRDVELDASGTWAGNRAELSLDLRGEVVEPLRRPLALHLDTTFEDGLLTATPVDASLGETWIVAEGKGHLREREADLRIHGGVEARSARRFGVPLESDLAFEGEVIQQGTRTELELDVTPAEGGSIHVAGNVDAATRHVDVRSTWRGVDPSTIVRGAPEGNAAGSAAVEGTLVPRDLHVAVRIEEGRLAGADVGPVEGEARIRQPAGGGPLRIEVDHARARLPGASVSAEGTLTGASIDLHLDARLEDLARVRDWLVRSFGLRLPPLEGKGTVHVDAVGPRRDLRVHLVSDLEELRVAGARASGLHVEAEASRVGAGWPAGAAKLRAATLDVDSFRFERVRLQAERDDDGAFRASLSTAKSSEGRAGAALCMDGMLRPGFLKIDLGRAALRRGDLDVEARGSATAAEGRAIGRAEVAVGQVGIVRASYDGPVDPVHAPASDAVELQLNAEPLDLGGLARVLDRPLPAGRLRARLAVAGTLGEPDLELDARATGLWFARAPAVGPIDARLEGRYRGEAGRFRRGDLEVALDAFGDGRRLLEVAAAAPLDLRAIRVTPKDEIARMLRSPKARIAGELMGVDLAAVGAAIDRPALHGAAAASLDLRGPLHDPRGRASLEVRGGPFGPAREAHAFAVVSLEDDSVRVSARVGSEQAGGEARATLEVGASIAQILARRVDPRAPVSATLELQDVDLEELTSDRSEEDGRLSGVLSGRASLGGTLAAPCGDGLFRARRVGAHGARLGDAELSVALDASRLQTRLHAIDEAGGTLAAGLELGDRWLERIASKGELAALPARLRLEADGISLSPLGKAFGAGAVGGTLDASLEADAPLAELAPVGVLTIDGGSIELPGGTIYERISARIVLREDLISLQTLDVHSARGGGFFVNGTIGGGGGRPFQAIAAALVPAVQTGQPPAPFSFEVRADELPVSGPGGPLATVTVRDRLEGSVGPDVGVSATLTIASARVELAPRPPRSLQPVGPLPDVVFVPGATPRGAGPASRAKRVLPIAFHLVAPGNVVVSGTDVQIEAQADLFVVREADGTLAATGQARTTRGEVKVVGRTFVLEHAELRWTGGPPRNPHVDVSARYDAPQATAWADVGGTLRDLVIHLRSDPPMSESQIVMLVVSGRTQTPGVFPVESQPMGREGQAGQGAAASLLGAAASLKLRQALGPRVPVQILTSQTSTGQTVVEAGTYVARNLYVGFVRNFLAEPGENSNEVRAQYELSRTVGIQTRFGDAGDGGVDVVWEKQIATPAQQRARKASPPPRPPLSPRGEKTPAETAPPD